MNKSYLKLLWFFNTLGKSKEKLGIIEMRYILVIMLMTISCKRAKHNEFYVITKGTIPHTDNILMYKDRGVIGRITGSSFIGSYEIFRASISKNDFVFKHSQFRMLQDSPNSMVLEIVNPVNSGDRLSNNDTVYAEEIPLKWNKKSFSDTSKSGFETFIDTAMRRIDSFFKTFRN